jgi:hypoxanthine phosphoribosyltransferase
MLEDIVKVKKQADCLWLARQLLSVYERLAAEIERDMAQSDPLVLCVMNGGLFITAEILRRLEFPLQLEYVHATRYHDELEGGHIDWIHFPANKVKGRRVLIMDDILDVGITLRAIQQECRNAGASEVRSLVLAIKQHDRRIKDVSADYVGVEVEDRYVFGCGMDYKGYHRNLDGIYALKDQGEMSQ